MAMPGRQRAMPGRQRVNEHAIANELTIITLSKSTSNLSKETYSTCSLVCRLPVQDLQPPKWFGCDAAEGSEPATIKVEPGLEEAESKPGPEYTVMLICNNLESPR